MNAQIEEINNFLKNNDVFITANLKEFTLGNQEGHLLETSNGTISFTISNYQQCYEDWGYDSFIENKEYQSDFIGAKILEIHQECPRHDEFKDDALPLLIKTNKGNIDLWVYNTHNGYYAHSYCITIFGDLFDENSL